MQGYDAKKNKFHDYVDEDEAPDTRMDYFNEKRKAFQKRNSGDIVVPTAKRSDARVGSEGGPKVRTPKGGSRIVSQGKTSTMPIATFQQSLNRKSNSNISTFRTLMTEANAEAYRKARHKAGKKAREANYAAIRKVIRSHPRCESINDGTSIKTLANRFSYNEFDVSMGMREDGTINFDHLNEMLAYAEITSPEIVAAIGTYQAQEALIKYALKSNLSNEDMTIMMSPQKGVKMSLTGQSILLAEIQKDKVTSAMMEQYKSDKAKFDAQQLDVETADGATDALRGTAVGVGVSGGLAWLGGMGAKALMTTPAGWVLLGIGAVAGIVSAFWRSGDDVAEDKAKIEEFTAIYRQRLIPALLIEHTRDAIIAQMNNDGFDKNNIPVNPLTEAQLNLDGYSYNELDIDGNVVDTMDSMVGLAELPVGYTYIFHKDTGTAVPVIDYGELKPLPADATEKEKVKREKEVKEKQEVVALYKAAETNTDATLAALLPIVQFYQDEGSQELGETRKNGTLEQDNPFTSQGMYKNTTLDRLKAADLGYVNNTQNLSLADGVDKVQDGVADAIDKTTGAISDSFSLLKYVPYIIAGVVGYKLITGGKSNGNKKPVKSRVTTPVAGRAEPIGGQSKQITNKPVDIVNGTKAI